MQLVYKIPALKESFGAYNTASKSQIKSKVNSTNLSLGATINNIANITGVSSKLIESIGFIESGGNPNAVSSAGAVGFMGLKPSSATDILVMENLKKRISIQESIILKKYLGDRFTEGILKMKYLGNKVTVNGVTSSSWITQTDLLIPELNILIGAILLGILVDEESKDGLRLDRVAYRYNQGYFASVPSGTITEVVASKLAPEGKNYILKLVGTNGVLDAIV